MYFSIYLFSGNSESSQAVDVHYAVLPVPILRLTAVSLCAGSIHQIVYWPTAV